VRLRRRGPQTISPTAHYTGYVWAQHGLGPRELATKEGRVLYRGLQPIMAISGALGGPTLEGFLLARHRLIDHLLDQAIEQGPVSQVIEIAAGMSPRGHEFVHRYGERISYIEADLPAMAERKRQALAKLGTLGPSHRVEQIDALRDEGPDSLAALVADLDPHRGVAVISEGLLNYLSPADVKALWIRIASTVRNFRHGLYLSDLHLAGENSGRLDAAFATVLGAFVRGQLHFHFVDAPEAEAALRLAGFDVATLHRPADFADQIAEADTRGARAVRVIEARTTHR
jgi:O-methyltransferase involved in polyketide biosynthesis